MSREALVDVLIVAAMPEELAPLRSALADRRRMPGSEALVLETGWLGGRRVALAVTGDGARRARAAASALLATTRARSLLAIGVAGALTPGLHPGDLLVARRVLRGDGASVEAERLRVDAAAAAARARPGVVVSAARIADSAAEKGRLRVVAAGGDEGRDSAEPAVVDLESWSIVAAATASAVPWLVLRAVSDTAEEALPALLNQSLDDGGAVRRGRVLLGLLGQPSALPRLLELRSRVLDAAAGLGQAVAALIACEALSAAA